MAVRPDVDVEIRSTLHRVVPMGPEERARSKGMFIHGYAAVFGELSEDLGGFREIILPGAFDRALREGHDVRALFNHNPDIVLGRTKAETLSLSIDDTGLWTEIDLPDTQMGRDLLVSVERGDIDGMSFAFRTLTDNWRMEDGEPIRELVDLELFDVSPAAFPAYPQTVVSSRARDHASFWAKAKERKAREVPLAINELRQRLQEVS